MAVRLPKVLVDDFNLTDGSSVQVISNATGIMIKPEHKVSVPTLRELARSITPKNRQPIVDWGKRCGREIW